MAGLGDAYRHPDSHRRRPGRDRTPARRAATCPSSAGCAPTGGATASPCVCSPDSTPASTPTAPTTSPTPSVHGRAASSAPGPGRVVLVFRRRDPLADVVPALPVRSRPSVAAARRSGGGRTATPWTVQVAGSHLLVAGATGAGKGSVIWSLIRGMAAACTRGRVQLWCMDPKGGMELSAGAAMFTRFAYDHPAGMADLLDAAVEQLHDRAKRMRAEGRRTHTPTVADPLVVVVVDELAFLTAYLPDRDLKKRITNALSVLLSKGRAVGFSVSSLRSRTPARKSPRSVTCSPPGSGCGSPNPNSPASCSGPAPTTAAPNARPSPSPSPGVGYVVLDGHPDPVRVRAAWVSDDDIAAMAEQYPARRGEVIDTTVVE